MSNMPASELAANIDRPAVSRSQGYALTSPAGVILPHTYRATASSAVASLFPTEEHRNTYWKAAEAEGWTVAFVYAHLFTPAFFITKVAEAQDAAEEMAVSA